MQEVIFIVLVRLVAGRMHRDRQQIRRVYLSYDLGENLPRVGIDRRARGVQRLVEFRVDLQRQYDLAVVERERGPEIEKRVRSGDAA